MFERLFGRSGRAGAPSAADPPPETASHDAALASTRRGWLSRLGAVFGPIDITTETWDELETQLIAADVGAGTAVALVDALRARASQAGVRRADELPALLRAVMVRALQGGGDPGAGSEWATADGAPAAPPRPWVILLVGVNGSGKTTSAAKLARRHAAAGRSVLLVAADTFRAAAIDQLEAWANRAGVGIIKGTPGGDPGAVVFDALRSQAGARADVVIVDTAGRLHTQHNLMAELAKVNGIIGREVPGAPHETLLVLDATTGQNGLAQARQFTAATHVTGLVLAKLDGSAKGGIAFPICRELGIRIAYIGTGEGMDDLAAFDASAYVDGLLASDGNSAR
ncbi:MAG: signal recognition particle-docking protein FtsY [Ardenticatenales bacterium]|nr:signal recognition particle-docking protein FtsY [Ardenticatenales bacterium]